VDVADADATRNDDDVGVFDIGEGGCGRDRATDTVDGADVVATSTTLAAGHAQNTVRMHSSSSAMNPLAATMATMTGGPRSGVASTQ
jgi:hypothetical protein